MGMSATLLAPRRRPDLVELMMVTVYVIATAYLFACSSQPRIASALRDVVTPFQVIVRARNTGAERSAAVWRFSALETRTRYRC